MIKPCTEMRLIEHGLSLKIELSSTLSTEVDRQGVCPFNRYSQHKLVTIESTPEFKIYENKDFSYSVSKYLFSIGIKGLVHVIWAPLYRGVDTKGGDTYFIESTSDESDSELIGFVYINKDRVRKSHSVEFVSASIKRAEIVELKDSVEQYTVWSNNDIYGVSVTDTQGVGFKLGLGAMSYHGINNTQGNVDNVVNDIINYAERQISRSEQSIGAVIKINKQELVDDGWQDSIPLSAYLNSKIETMFGTKLVLARAKTITIKGKTKKEVMEAVTLKVDVSRLPDNLKLSKKECDTFKKRKHYGWREVDELSEWQLIRIHRLLASIINKIGGFELLYLGEQSSKTKDYLKIPWRRPVASRNYKKTQ